MNLLFLTLLYHPSRLNKTQEWSKTGLQSQINSLQWALVKGMTQGLDEGSELQLVNALPVGIFPTQYRKMLLPSWKEQGFMELGGLNLPICKQLIRRRKAYRALRAWVKASPDNRTILLYTIYLPYLQAVAKLKKKHPEVKVTAIVTDLPNQWGIFSGRRGLSKKLEQIMGKKQLALASVMDRFVLLTEQMADILPIQGKPYWVMEGMVLPTSENACGDSQNHPISIVHPPMPVVLYTGTLNREFGIDNLLEAFQGMKNCQLWLCGTGDMDTEVKEAAQTHSNIRFFGFVSQTKALQLQQVADILINPRSPGHAFTKYSFPSKTLEYMHAGKPVVCYALEGIPREYDPYLIYIQKEGASGIRETLMQLLVRPLSEREEIGQRAKHFVCTYKNATVQSSRLLQFLQQTAQDPQ